MFNQHTEMRDQLQNRHDKMVNDVNGFTNCRVELHGLDMTRDVTGPSSKELLGQADIGMSREGDKSCMCIIYNEGCSGGRRRLAESEIIVNTMENHHGAKMIKIMNEFGSTLGIDLNNVKGFFLALKDSMVELQDSVDRIAERLDMEVIDPKTNEAKSKKSKKSKAMKDDGGEEEVPDEESLFNRNLHETGVEGEEKASGNEEAKRTAEAMELKLDSVEKKMDSVENKMTGITIKDEVELIKGKVDKIEGKVDKIEAKVQSMEGKVESMESKVDKIEKSMEELKDMLSKLVMGGGAAAV